MRWHDQPVEILLETDRLMLRRFTPHDVDALVALHNDPAVMRYLGPPTETPENVTDVMIPRFLDFYDRYEGFGYWAASERATGEFLGWFLFRPPHDAAPGEIELGYRLHTAAWGRGFATEGSVALVERGFAKLGVERVMATTMTINAGSRRVMEKVGLRFVRTFHEEHEDPVDGTEHGEVEYALTRDEWSAASRVP